MLFVTESFTLNQTTRPAYFDVDPPQQDNYPVHSQVNARYKLKRSCVKV